MVYPYRDQHVWTPEQKVRVCVLYTEGVSFTLIAERMTTEIRMAVSKNMIAGLIGRLVKAKKVERRHDEPKPLSDARKKPKAEKPAKTKKAAEPKKAAPKKSTAKKTAKKSTAKKAVAKKSAK